MAKYDLILYDCDGTLYNTYEGVKANFENTLKVLGYAPMPEDFNWNICIGPLLEWSMEYALKLPKDRIDEAIAQFRSTYHDFGVNGSILYPGIRESLLKLKQNGVRIGVASSKLQDSLEKTIWKDGITGLFDVIEGCTPGTQKTKAETIETALEKSGIAREKVLMLGDTKFDAEGAALEKMDFAAALWGFGTEKEFDPYDCVFKAKTPMEVADFVIG